MAVRGWYTKNGPPADCFAATAMLYGNPDASAGAGPASAVTFPASWFADRMEIPGAAG